MRVRQLTLGLTLAALGLTVPIGAQQATAPLRNPDVIFVPTPPEVVDAMLKAAEVTSNDTVYDLGCGDGIIVATAAQKFGAHAVGIDIDPQRVKEATDRITKAGVTDKVKILNQDLVHDRHQPGDGGDPLSAALAQSEADSEVEQGAQARDAHRVPELRHGGRRTRRSRRSTSTGDRCTCGRPR